MGRLKKDAQLTPEAMYSIMSGILGRYKKFKNHGHLLLSSTWHVYTFMAFSNYGQYTNAIFTGGYNGTLRTLDAWLTHFADHDHQADRECELLPGYQFRQKVSLSSSVSDSCDGSLDHRLILFKNH